MNAMTKPTSAEIVARLREAAKRAAYYGTGEAPLLEAAADALDAAEAALARVTDDSMAERIEDVLRDHTGVVVGALGIYNTRNAVVDAIRAAARTEGLPTSRDPL